MKKYRIMLEGRNLLLREDSQCKKFGFFTTRYVEAESASIAKETAFAMVKSELNNIMQNSTDDSLVLTVESIDEVISFGNNLVPGEGFSLYPEAEAV